VDNNQAKGVVLSDHAVFPNEKIFAKKIISDLTLVPTFLEMIGEDNIGSEMAEKISRFKYDEQNLFCLNLALDAAPQFISAEFDEGIQQSFEGYFGGESIKQVEAANRDLVNKVIHDIPIANYFIPTWADPTQAPEGCHTAILWLDVPPAPKSWKHGPLNGFDCWDDIKEKLADELVDEFEKYAAGFKNSILERLIYTPLDVYRNNPSAIHGNWMGGADIPEQFYMNRPLPGILQSDCASRTFIKNLYLSNSIHAGQSSLSAGYMAAVEVVKDMEAYDSNVFKAKAFEWLMENVDDIPKNLGVR
jgi:phytoene dehydrogenase-like protein